MRVRLVELRILGAILTALWAAAAGLVLAGYRPGGPADLLAGLAVLPLAAVAAAGVAWPPLARGPRAFGAVAWLAIGAILLLVPSLAALAAQLAARGPRALLPSPEVAYPWALAALATGAFAGLGIARRWLGETALRRRRLALGLAIGAALAAGGGAPFGAVTLVNEAVLAARPPAASRFGPTDPSLPLPRCGQAVAAGATARVTATLDLVVDGRTRGRVGLEGARNGRDVRWTAWAATDVAAGRQGRARLGPVAWRFDGSGWRRTPLADADGHDLDLALVERALRPADLAVAGTLGEAVVEGARARQCRIRLTGAMLRTAVPAVELLVGAADLGRWTGDLDYWVFADGQLGRADARLTGPAAGLVPDALTVTVRVRLEAVDRGGPVTLGTPGS